MKFNMKTLCSIGALALCAEGALAMTEIRNGNESTRQMASAFSDPAIDGLLNIAVLRTNNGNVLVGNDTLSSLEGIIKCLDCLIDLDGIIDVGLNKEQLLRKKHLNQKLLNNLTKPKAVHPRIIDESMEAAAQMFEEAEQLRVIDESIESAAQMFEEAENETAQAMSQVVASESYYFKFEQFFKSMWYRFTESRLGRVFKGINQFFFKNS